MLKLNAEESVSLFFIYDSYKVMQKYLSSSMTLDFETNDMLDHAHQEIMDMHFQDVFDIE